MGKPKGLGSRRALRLLIPRTQLMLTGFVTLISAGFAAVFAWHAYAAYAGLYAMLASSAPESFLNQVNEQASAFVWVSGAIGIAYVVVIVGFCVAYSSRMLGPIVPLRRRIEAMKNGDSANRVELRERDTAFQPIADDLNELGMMLEEQKRARFRH